MTRASGKNCGTRWGLALSVLTFFGAAGFAEKAEAQLPDLEMASWTTPPVAVGAGSTFDITFSVGNYRSYLAGPHTVTFYYGDTTSTTGIVAIGSYSMPPVLGATIVGPITVSVTLPNSVANGTRYIHYFVDSANAVAEDDETDNRGYHSISIVGHPDLQVTTLSIAPTSQYPGAGLTVTYRVRNAGPTRTLSASAVRFYYSADASITTADTYLGTEVAIPVDTAAGAYIPAGADGTFTATVPAAASPGARYIGAIADYGGTVPEADESNNTRSAALTVLTPYADLVMDTWSAPGTATGAGASVTINFTVRNQGRLDSPSTFVAFYYGDGTATTGLSRITVVPIPALTVGGMYSGSATGTLPNDVLSGSRYIHYHLDSIDLVTELDEANNRGYRPMTITGRPDLQVTVLSVVPASQVPGGTLTVTYRVQNAGVTRTPAASGLRFYYSTDSTITTADTYLSVEVGVPADLGAGAYSPASGSGTTTVVVPAAATLGTRYIGAYADFANVITESDETNNTRAAAFTVVSSGGTPCSVPGDCATGFCVDGVCCNSACGGGIPTDCMACSVRAGGAVDGVCGPRAAGVTCGSSTDTACDNPDTCDAAGTCLNNYEPTTTVCRPDAGDCDVPEYCDGAGNCPADAFEAAGHACGDASDTVCDNPDTCDASGSCRPNHEPTTVVCRADAGECDVPENCDGAGACPEDAFEIAGHACGDASDTVCDNPDTCDASGVCRANYEPDTVVCRAAAGECDVAENCDGAGACPADAFVLAGTPCGDSTATTCDLADTCDGAGTCGANFAPATTVCRAAAGDCDAEESCDGAGNCPPDALRPAGAACGDSTETVCDHADSCDASGVCLDNFAGTDVPCRASTGVCDPAENCDGAGACPADVFVADGTACSDDELCTNTECVGGACTVVSTIEGCCEVDADCEVPFEMCVSNTCVGILCRRCAADDECGPTDNRCVSLTSGSFCAVACDPAVTGACPVGYVCGEPGGDHVCLPEAGDCACTPRAYEACEGGDLIWFDSCGEAGEVSEDCGGRGCAAGACCAVGFHLEGDLCVEDSAEGADGDADADGDGDADADGGGDVAADGGDDAIDAQGDAGGGGDGESGCGCRATSAGAGIPGLLVLLAFGLAFAAPRRRSR